MSLTQEGKYSASFCPKFKTIKDGILAWPRTNAYSWITRQDLKRHGKCGWSGAEGWKEAVVIRNNCGM